MAKRTSKLTKKEERFVDEYMKDLNAKRAYMVAFSCNNPNSARASGSRLLSNVNIKEELDKRRQELRDCYVGVREKIIERNMNILFQDFTQIVNPETGMIDDIESLTDEQRQCIKSIVPTRDGIKIEFESKEKAEQVIKDMLGLEEKEQTEKNALDLFKGFTKEDLIRIAFEGDEGKTIN